MENLKKTNLRFNLIITIIYALGIILVLSLFKMQVIDGDEYREMSNSRLIKKANIEATRGIIMDRAGEPYANTVLEYGVELYKTKISDEKLNSMSLELMTILENEEEKYNSVFPIQTNPFDFRYLNDEELLDWKKSNNIPEQATAKEAFYILKEKHDIQTVDDEDTRRILELREIIVKNDYGSVAGFEIADNVKRDTALKITENSHKIPGVNITTSSVRKYEKGTEASHLIGYIAPISEEELEASKEKDLNYKNDAKVGKTGTEKTFEEILKGTDGTKQIDMSVDGSVTGEFVTEEAIGGSNIILTIDSKLQTITESALLKVMDQINNGYYLNRASQTRGASAVVMNVNNGEILAMASVPSYDPSKFVNGISQSDWDTYVNSPLAPLLNRSIQSTYSPASTFKMVTAIAALESGVVGVDERILDRGVYPAAHMPTCWIYTSYGTTHGWMNAADALKNSCNYYFYEVGNRMGPEIIANYASYLGLGRKTGIEVQGEVEGFLATPETAAKKNETWTLGGTLSSAIGQSYNSFTPVQMAKYISMLSNGGKTIRPTIIKSIIDSNGTHMSRTEIDEIVENATGFVSNEPEQKEFKDENIQAVLDGMISVTGETGGTAYDAFKDFGIQVGGKTGTAEAGAMTNALFTGFAPFENPEIAVVVVVENGYEGFFLGETVREIMAQYFGLNTPTINENSNIVSEGEILVN